MDKTHFPVTPAVRLLREKKVAFEPHLYPYKEHGGTSHAAASLGVSERRVIKTLVMETERRLPLVVLMHGDCEVSTKALARRLGVKSVSPCDAAALQKHTGYMAGGVSPFGTRARMTVYVESSIFNLSKVYINGGKRGFLVAISPEDLRNVLPVEEVEVAIGAGES